MTRAKKQAVKKAVDELAFAHSETSPKAQNKKEEKEKKALAEALEKLEIFAHQESTEEERIMMEQIEKTRLAEGVGETPDLWAFQNKDSEQISLELNKLSESAREQYRHMEETGWTPKGSIKKVVGDRAFNRMCERQEE